MSDIISSTKITKKHAAVPRDAPFTFICGAETAAILTASFTAVPTAVLKSTAFCLPSACNIPPSGAKKPAKSAAKP